MSMKGFLKFFFIKTIESLMKNKEFWKTVIQIVISVLTALTTTLGVSACAL